MRLMSGDQVLTVFRALDPARDSFPPLGAGTRRCSGRLWPARGTHVRMRTDKGTTKVGSYRDRTTQRHLH
jgi:hypothetical protein